ncbi:hypothetical protein MUN77_06745 [Leucobacter allii]|uniref:hypothetical protein n=1 Tax=Leucobacter allii TaxID=2932247 RepID=UPI001FD3E274|nr:hypothetical protein [Leucobacter allii]UOR02991.1 hypothetical protein MUN77_06745 [Leucobacter allii]
MAEDAPQPHDRENDDADDEPYELATEDPADVPGFLGRAIAALEGTDDDAEFEGVDFYSTQGVRFVVTAAYDSDVVEASGPLGRRIIDYASGVRDALRDAWGAPETHEPRLVGEEREPEGILDYLMLSMGFASAELWDRGAYFVALVTRWTGEPEASDLHQLAFALSRDTMMRGMSAFIDDGDTRHPRLMRGELPEELHRRAWLLSTMFDRGEARLRGAPIEASRTNLLRQDGVTTTWVFADDGRQLLLFRDPECRFARMLDALEDDERLGLTARMLQGVPSDLLACLTAPGEGPRGVAEHALEFAALDGALLPRITGAYWFDGESWISPEVFVELAYQHGLDLEEFGFRAAVARPLRIGGDFTADDFAPQADPAAPDAEQRRSLVEAVFAGCPYPAQPRPEGDVRLGYGLPEGLTPEAVTEGIDRLTRAWWTQEVPVKALSEGEEHEAFRIGRIDFFGETGDREVHAALLLGDPWVVDAVQEWTTRLDRRLCERWGEAGVVRAHDRQTGELIKSPMTRFLRGGGFESARIWWVNGHAVLLCAGYSDDDEYGDRPVALMAVCKLDAVAALFGGMRHWEPWWRGRVVEELQIAMATGSIDGDGARTVPWAGPSLPGSGARGEAVVPEARRIVLRSGDFAWIWYRTHDRRGLIVACDRQGPEPTAEEIAARFAGVPEDLLSLVHDRDQHGVVPVVPTAQGALPAATAVLWADGLDWRASPGTVREVYDASVIDDVDPLEMLLSQRFGVAQLRVLLRMGVPLTAAALADPEYGRFMLGRAAAPEEVATSLAGFRSPAEAALTGTLDELLDVQLEAPEWRFLLDAVLSNRDPRARRELALWLLGATQSGAEGLDASGQFSFMTPVNVLLGNPTLDDGDADVLQALADHGADLGFGLLGETGGIDPAAQLNRRAAAGATVDRLREVLQEAAGPAPA